MPADLKLEDQGKLLSEHLAGHVRERAEKLSRFFGKLQQCRVVVDGPGQHPLPGLFRIRVYLTVPDSRIVINHRTGEDLPMAIRESFDAADQRLGDYARLAREASRDAKRRPSRSPER